MDGKLALRAVLYYAAGVLLVMGLLFIPMLCLGVVLWLKAPELLPFVW